MTRSSIIGLTVFMAAISFGGCGHAQPPHKEVQSKNVASIDVHFKKDKLIEVAFVSVKPGKQQQLMESYFKRVMPIAREYGMRPLARMNVQYTYSEFTKPHMIGFFEWESEGARRAFSEDPRFLEIKPIRDDALSSLRIGYFVVDEDTEVTFTSGQFMEVFAFWLNPDTAHRMQTYFDNVTPLITGTGNPYDVRFPLSLHSIPFGHDTYQPETFGVALWKSKESNDQFFGSAAYNTIKHDKEAAISRLDVWQGEIIID